MKIKLLIAFIFIIMLPYLAHGQKDYYATDSSLIFGAKLIRGNDLMNSKVCQIKKGESSIQFTPEEVREYGFKDGQVYLSKEVPLSGTTKTVFLERLVKASTSLYYYKGEEFKTYFIQEEDSSFVELPRKNSTDENVNFRKVLLDLTSDIPILADASKLLSYDKKSMSKFINIYNSGEDIKSFPYFKYGILVGYGILNMDYSSISDSYIHYMDPKSDGGSMIGFFIDKPISASNFSLHTELFYSKHGFSYNKFFEDNELDFIVNTSTINLPILFRYTFSSYKILPFINLGAYFNYNMKNENAIYETSTHFDGDIIVINKTLTPSFIAKSKGGISIGGGTEIKLNYKNSLFFELRYNKLLCLPEAESMNFSEINFITGINF